MKKLLSIVLFALSALCTPAAKAEALVQYDNGNAYVYSEGFVEQAIDYGAKIGNMAYQYAYSHPDMTDAEMDAYDAYLDRIMMAHAKALYGADSLRSVRMFFDIAGKAMATRVSDLANKPAKSKRVASK